jgi:membrane protease YdiL (CAAX protease family)
MNESTRSNRPILLEAGRLWFASVVICGLLGVVALFVPFISDNLLALVAAVFLYLPAWQLWKNQSELADYGLQFRPAARGMLLFVLVTVIVMPPFMLGHHYYQSLFFDRAPTVARDRLVRFSQDLDDRPDLPLRGQALHVWQESNRMMILWTGGGPISITLKVDVPHKIDPIRELRGFRQTTDRLLRDGLGGARVSHKGELSWSRGTTGGIGFSLHKVRAFTLESDAPRIKVGRYGISKSSPLEDKRGQWWWLYMFVGQLILVAVPEEWFYRGYLQQRFDDALGTKWRLWGAELGWGWIVSSGLFALGHLVLDPRPERLAVFFPSLLFGWMKARTGSVLAASLFHALSNVAIQTLNYLYL